MPFRGTGLVQARGCNVERAESGDLGGGEAGCQYTREERVVDRRGAVVRGWSRREEGRVWGIKS